MRVGLTYDLRSEYLAAGYSDVETAEFDQPETIDGIASALSRLELSVDRIGNARQLASSLASGSRWDLVFNFCEGLHGLGREAQVPCILDVYQIPYTFSDPLTLCVCLDKSVAKCVVRSAGVATPDYAVVRDFQDLELRGDLARIHARQQSRKGAPRYWGHTDQTGDDKGPECNLV